MSLINLTVIRRNGGLGRRTPLNSKVIGLIGTGVAVAGKLVLGQSYTLKSTRDAKLLGLDRAYDDTNNILVYHHIERLFMRDPSSEVHFMLAAQTERLSTLFDKTKLFAKKLLKDNGGKIKYIGGFMNPDALYAPIITDGIEADVILAIAKAQELYADEALQYRFASFLIEGRGFSGNAATVKDMRTLNAPNVSVTLLADPAISGLKAAYNKYAAVGDVLGLKSLAAISQNFGELIPDFNLTNDANGAFTQCGLSGNQNISAMADTDLETLDGKGFIIGYSVPTLDGFFISDTPTCSPITDNDYAYIEANSVTEAAISYAIQKLLPKTKSRLLVDVTTGLLLPEIKAFLENEARSALKPLQDAGDISGGIDAQIPNEYVDANGVTQVQNLLAKSQIYFEITCVPVAIGRKITIGFGLTNPNKR
jgi:hypothetical protein